VRSVDYDRHGRTYTRYRRADTRIAARIDAALEWTRDGRLRHPRYEDLRDDKPSHEIVREEPSP
jgi:hypothetical protein